MPNIAFTDLVLRSLKADERTDFWDTKTPGFGIRIGRHTKTFMVKVNNRRITIGPYGDDLSLAEARKRALAHKSEANPTRGASVRFERALEQYLTHSKAALRPRVASERERILRTHLSPKLGNKALDRVTDQQIGEIIEGVLDTPSTANHVFKEARTFFRWAAKSPRRYITHSPLVGMEMPVKERHRRRVLNDSEIQSIWNAADQQGYPYGTILKMLMVTGQRRGEIAALQRPWINERDRLITLPEQLTKNGIEHTFPYGNMFAELLDTVPRFNDTYLLFPARGHTAKPFNGWSKSKANLEHLPPLRPWVLHDLRRNLSTRLSGELDVAQRVIDRLLNHISQGEITPLGRVYNQATLLKQMRLAVDQFDCHLRQVLAA